MSNTGAALRRCLLAALFAWALVVCLASFFGLGGKIGHHSPQFDASPLPSIPSYSESAIVDPDNSEAIARPLFSDDRRPHPFFLEDQQLGKSAIGRLTGVIVTPELEMITLALESGQPLRLRLGEEQQFGWRLVSLQPRSAVVSGPSGVVHLELEVAGSNLRASEERNQPIQQGNTTSAQSIPNTVSTSAPNATASDADPKQVQRGSIRNQMQLLEQTQSDLRHDQPPQE